MGVSEDVVAWTRDRLWIRHWPTDEANSKLGRLSVIGSGARRNKNPLEWFLFFFVHLIPMSLIISAYNLAKAARSREVSSDFVNILHQVGV